MILLGVIAALAALSPLGFRHLRHRRRQQRVARQLRLSLQAMAHALQVGHSFLQALERAAQDSDPPLAMEWARVVQSVRLGTPLREALEDLGQRVQLAEMRWFISAAKITQESGGSLSTVLESLAGTLLERETLGEKLAALTAQGKASGVLLTSLPFLMLIALYFIAPEMVTPFITMPLGQMMLAGVIVMVSIGGWVMFKIVSLGADQ
jgi:tight adherence protein B